MQINKVWLSGLIAYVFGQIALKYGVTFNNYWADVTAEFIITFVIPPVVAWLNRTKKTEVPNEPLIPTESNK